MAGSGNVLSVTLTLHGVTRQMEIPVDIENTSGPLGLGHAFGIGAAIAERFLAARFGENVAHNTYLYISDGGVQANSAHCIPNCNNAPGARCGMRTCLASGYCQ